MLFVVRRFSCIVVPGTRQSPVHLDYPDTLHICPHPSSLCSTPTCPLNYPDALFLQSPRFFADSTYGTLCIALCSVVPGVSQVQQYVGYIYIYIILWGTSFILFSRGVVQASIPPILVIDQCRSQQKLDRKRSYFVTTTVRPVVTAVGLQIAESNRMAPTIFLHVHIYLLGSTGIQYHHEYAVDKHSVGTELWRDLVR